MLHGPSRRLNIPEVHPQRSVGSDAPQNINDVEKCSVNRNIAACPREGEGVEAVKDYFACTYRNWRLNDISVFKGTSGEAATDMRKHGCVIQQGQYAGGC